MREHMEINTKTKLEVDFKKDVKWNEDQAIKGDVLLAG